MGEVDYKKLEATLGEMIARASNPERPLNEIGLMMVGEQKKNIEQGGRPEKFEPSIRVKRSGGQTLRMTGHLMNSLTYGVNGLKVVAGPGSAVSKYARILDEGGTIKAKNKPFLKFFIPAVGWIQKKEVTIPPRHYTYIPEEAGLRFGTVMQKYLIGR